MRRYAIFTAAAAVMVVSVVGDAPGQPSLEDTKAKVLAKDLESERIRIIGLLGVEYGKPMTVVGRWEEPPVVTKHGLYFFVTHVNGQKLDVPVKFNPQNVSTTSIDKEDAKTPRAGQVWEGRCWEGGRYWQPTNVIHEELGKPPVGVAHAGFESELHFYLFTNTPASKP